MTSLLLMLSIVGMACFALGVPGLLVAHAKNPFVPWWVVLASATALLARPQMDAYSCSIFRSMAPYTKKRSAFQSRPPHFQRRRWSQRKERMKALPQIRVVVAIGSRMRTSRSRPWPSVRSICCVVLYPIG